MSLRVPPAPRDLTDQPALLGTDSTDGLAQNDDDIAALLEGGGGGLRRRKRGKGGKEEKEEEEYDVAAEKWQYLSVSVRGAFAYTVRLPKGLQHKGIPEVQLELPAVLLSDPEAGPGSHCCRAAAATPCGACCGLLPGGRCSRAGGEKEEGGKEGTSNPLAPGKGDSRGVTSQCFHVTAPKEIDKGNRLQVVLPLLLLLRSLLVLAVVARPFPPTYVELCPSAIARGAPLCFPCPLPVGGLAR